MTKAARTGPRWIRLLIVVLSVLLFLFYTWLLLFVVNDIRRLAGPDYQQLEAQHVGQPLLDQRQMIATERDSVARQIADRQEMQQLRAQGTASSQATLGQLIELHRAAVERGVDLNPAEQAAFAESQALFLQNQREYQQVNDELAQLTARRQRLQLDSEQVEEQIHQASQPAREAYQQQLTRHRYRQAALKLSLLLPVLFVSALLVMRMGSSVYRPMVFPLLPASLLLTGMVMHEHFPSQVFKYVAISAGIVVVIAILYRLIRVIVAPRGEWLLSRYREAYYRQQCPVCAHPIAASADDSGALAVVEGALRLTTSASGAKPYTCPACGTRLFDKCPRCQHVRHSLLPFCTSCGDRVEIAAP